MDDKEQPWTPKLENEDILRPDNVTPTREILSQIEVETSTAMPGTLVAEPLQSRTKSKETGLIILAVVLVLVALALIGGVVWFVLVSNTSRDSSDGTPLVGISEDGNNGEEKSSDEPASKDEVVELSINDELVQRLYEPFTSYPGINGFGFRTFYDRVTEVSGNPETALIGQILWATGKEVDCIDETETSFGYCVSAEAIHQRFQEAFGYDFVDRNIDDYGPCGGVQFIKEANQYFLSTGCGGSAPAKLNHRPYKAERQGKYLYLYELVEVWQAEFSESSGEFIRNKHCHFDKVCSETPTKGEDLLNIGSEVFLVGDDDDEYYRDPSLIAVNFREYVEELDMVRWTFVWNEENYVFEKLERV